MTKHLTMTEAANHKASVEYRDARFATMPRGALQGTLEAEVSCPTCGILQNSQIFLRDCACYCNECNGETILLQADVDKMHHEALTAANHE